MSVRRCRSLDSAPRERRFGARMVSRLAGRAQIINAKSGSGHRALQRYNQPIACIGSHSGLGEPCAPEKHVEGWFTGRGTGNRQDGAAPGPRRWRRAGDRRTRSPTPARTASSARWSCAVSRQREHAILMTALSSVGARHSSAGRRPPSGHRPADAAPRRAAGAVGSSSMIKSCGCSPGGQALRAACAAPSRLSRRTAGAKPAGVARCDGLSARPEWRYVPSTTFKRILRGASYGGTRKEARRPRDV